MLYKRRKRINPQKPDEKPLYYCAPVRSNVMTMEEIAAIISRGSTLTRGDVYNVVSNYFEEACRWMCQGDSVQMGAIGTFRISFSSKGVESPEEVTARLVTKRRIIFTPSKEFKRAIEEAPIHRMKD